MRAFEIRFVPHQHTAVVFASSPLEGIADSMGTALAKAFDAVGQAGAEPAGPPFARYLSFEPDHVDFEAGVEVPAPFPPTGEATPGDLGGCEAAVAMHVGPYEALATTYDALTRWVASQGRVPGGGMWERYLTDPDAEPDPSRWMTEVFVPLA